MKVRGYRGRQVRSLDVFVWRRRGGRVGSHVSVFQPAHSITGGVVWTLFGLRSDSDPPLISLTPSPTLSNVLCGLG